MLAFILTPPAAAAGDTPELAYRVVASYPHDIQHFTQGLEISEGKLYESTGGYGKSGLYIKDLRKGTIIRQTPIQATIFGEGLTLLKDRIFVLTWREGLALMFDSKLREQRRYRIPREGWGLTHMPTLAGERLLMSNGSSQLFQLDPESLQETGRLGVTDNGRAVERLNELEYARGEVYANVWTSPKVAVIQTGNGQVRAWVDFGKLSTLFEKPAGWNADEHVLNGIAYDDSTGHFFITGKCWPTLFEVEIDNR